MTYHWIKGLTCAVCAAAVINSNGIMAKAAASDTLPAAGVGLAFEEGGSVADIKEDVAKTVSGNGVSGNSVSGNTVSQNNTLLAQKSVSVNKAETKEQNTKEDVFGMLAAGEGVAEQAITDSVKGELEKSAKTVSGDAVPAETETQDTAQKEIVDIVLIHPEDIDILRDDNEEDFRNLVIAQVNDYVNVRSLPGEEGEIVGKLYDESAGSFLEEEGGWYKIQSGNVTGYVKAEYCVTGEDAQTLAKQVGIRMATVNTETLNVRREANTESSIIEQIPIQDELIVNEEKDGWLRVNVEAGDGWISTDYVTLSTEFKQAESKEAEEKRLAKEKAAREAANAAASKRRQEIDEQESGGKGSAAASVSVSGSGQGSSVAQYALQFVGNPYVYGGTSLTNGADCSGFVMSVYRQFGVSLPHSSSADRSMGYAVDGLDSAQPGDLVCYSGHVALYIGNGQIVHASTEKTGIKVSNADYRKVLAVRRIF